MQSNSVFCYLPAMAISYPVDACFHFSSLCCWRKLWSSKPLESAVCWKKISIFADDGDDETGPEPGPVNDGAQAAFPHSRLNSSILVNGDVQTAGYACDCCECEVHER